MSERQPITRRKLSDEVFDRLKAQILSGTLGPGDALPSERELMVQYEVGRPAIREAMQALANLGLISISHGERARVQEMSASAVFRQINLPMQMLISSSPESFADLMGARVFFEAGMVRMAAETATEAQVALLHERIEAQAARTHDIDAFIECDIAFHTEIARISGNPIFEAVALATLGWLRRYRGTMLHWAGNETVTLAEHRDIVAQIARHDPVAAEAAVKGHLERSSSLYVHQPVALQG